MDADTGEITDTYDCRRSGCTGDARHNRGPYAYMCDDHAEQAKQARASGRGMTQSHPTPRGGPASPLKALALALVPTAAKLDVAMTKKRLAHDDAKTAVAAFNEALKELREAAQRLLS